MFLNMFVVFVLCLTHFSAARTNSVTYIVFILNNTIYAHASDKADLRTIGTAYHGLQLDGQDIFAAANSPTPPDSGFGFHHGIWSPDQQQLVYLQIQFPRYQLQLFADNASQLLLEAVVTAQRGYLVPLGWQPDGKILLLERHSLYTLNTTVRIWQLDPTTQALTPYANTSVGTLHGQNILLSDSQAFIGFDREKGYVFDFANAAFSTFEAKVSYPTSPSSVFETHPIRILGVLSSSELVAFINQLNPAHATSYVYPGAFLHWPLPATERRITCYPDSPHTAANFEVTCPPLGRLYEGHEGTDIGGLPDGLPLGTAVYPAAAGIVIDTYTLCDTSTPACGDAYGNYITLEHHLVVQNDIQTWFTGYGHLQTVRTSAFTPITDLTLPIGASGSTGQGGPHLHFEVRYPHIIGESRWIDPWADPILWIGGSAMPISAENS